MWEEEEEDEKEIEIMKKEFFIDFAITSKRKKVKGFMSY